MWALLALWAYVKVDRMTQMPLWAFGSKKARAMHPKKRSSIARVMRRPPTSKAWSGLKECSPSAEGLLGKAAASADTAALLLLGACASPLCMVAAAPGKDSVLPTSEGFWKHDFTSSSQNLVK